MSKVWSVLFHNTRLLRRKTSYTPESSIFYFSLQHWWTDYRFFEQTLEGLKRLCITLTADGKSVTKIKLLVVCFQPFLYLKMKTSAFTVNEILFLQYFLKSWPTADYKKRSETRVNFFFYLLLLSTSGSNSLMLTKQLSAKTKTSVNLLWSHSKMSHLKRSQRGFQVSQCDHLQDKLRIFRINHFKGKSSGNKHRPLRVT